MPKVSVIIPVYGVEKYIGRCAESLFAQTLDDIEFIFIDDCTPDRSMEVLNTVIENNRHRMVEKNWKVRTERMPKNSGLPSVRKHGIQLATGQFVIACDSDDYVDKEMYETMYNYAVNNECDLVHCDIEIVDDSKTLSVLSSKKETLNSDELKNLIIEGNISNSLCNKLVKKNIYTENLIIYPKYNMDEDNTIAVQLALFSNKFGYIHKSFYHAYVNTESMSRKIGDEQLLKRYDASLNNSKIIIEVLKRNGYSDNSYAVLRAKNRPKMVLWPLTSRENAKLWRETYSEINLPVLFHSKISYKLKLIYLIAIMGLYPIYNVLVKH